MRNGSARSKGYDLGDFTDAFVRFLPSDGARGKGEGLSSRG